MRTTTPITTYLTSALADAFESTPTPLPDIFERNLTETLDRLVMLNDHFILYAHELAERVRAMPLAHQYTADASLFAASIANAYLGPDYHLASHATFIAPAHSKWEYLKRRKRTFRESRRFHGVYFMKELYDIASTQYSHLLDLSRTNKHLTESVERTGRITRRTIEKELRHAFMDPTLMRRWLCDCAIAQISVDLAGTTLTERTITEFLAIPGRGGDSTLADYIATRASIGTVRDAITHAGHQVSETIFPQG